MTEVFGGMALLMETVGLLTYVSALRCTGKLCRSSLLVGALCCATRFVSLTEACVSVFSLSLLSVLLSTVAATPGGGTWAGVCSQRVDVEDEELPVIDEEAAAEVVSVIPADLAP